MVNFVCFGVKDNDALKPKPLVPWDDFQVLR
jgi:hypothetical protein